MDRYNHLINAWSDHEMDAAHALSSYLYGRYEPESVIDLGCGSGLFLLGFIANGADTLGIDGEPEGGKLIPNFKVADLRQLKAKELITHTYDLALSLEVAEHLEEKYADNFVNIVASSADRIIFSAAKPGQVGTNHYNCQPKEYWLDLFKKYKVAYSEPETITLVGWMRGNKDFINTPWLEENIMILRKLK